MRKLLLVAALAALPLASFAEDRPVLIEADAERVGLVHRTTESAIPDRFDPLMTGD